MSPTRSNSARGVAARLVLLLALPFSLAACDARPSSTADLPTAAERDAAASPAAELTADKTDHRRRPVLVVEPLDPLDAGAVAFRSELLRTLRVSNVSDQTLQLAVAGVSCNCTRAAFDRQRLDPGQHATLTITIDVTIPGPQTQAVRIHALSPDADTDAQPLASETIPISFTPDRAFEVFPPSVAFETLPDVPTRHHIRFTGFGLDDQRIIPKRASIWNDDPAWRVIGIEQAADGMEGPQWVVTVEGAWDQPRTADDWLIIHTSDPTVPEWSVRLSGRVLAPVSLSPSAVIAEVGADLRFELTPHPDCTVLAARLLDHSAHVDASLDESLHTLTATPLRPGRYELKIAVRYDCRPTQPPADETPPSTADTDAADQTSTSRSFTARTLLIVP